MEEIEEIEESGRLLLEKRLERLEEDLLQAKSEINSRGCKITKLNQELREEKNQRVELVDRIHKMRISYDPGVMQYTIAQRFSEQLIMNHLWPSDLFDYLVRHISMSMCHQLRQVDFAMAKKLARNKGPSLGVIDWDADKWVSVAEREAGE